MADIKNYTLSFGPQHPAARGVLHLVLGLDGEVIQRADPHIDLLYRTAEKLVEQKTWIQSVPYMDCLDYASMMVSKHAYVMATERLLGPEMPLHVRYIRVMFDEITWIMSHLIRIGSHALDVGTMAVFLYAFREHEDLFDMYEVVSGACMHAAYYRPDGVHRGLPDTMPQYKASKMRNGKTLATLNEACSDSLLDFTEGFTNRFPRRVNEYETLLTDNRTWKRRLVGIGAVSPERALSKGFSGAMLRGFDIEWDVRRKQPYEIYDRIDFDIPVGANGDCCDRYLMCVGGMRQSNRIVRRCIEWLRKNPGPVITDNRKVAPPSRMDMRTSMEELIHHFKLFTEGVHVSEDEMYAVVKHPKGEFGIYAISDDANRPCRLKARAPGFVHLAALDEMTKSHMIADAVTIIDMQDIMFSKIDRRARSKQWFDTQASAAVKQGRTPG